MRRSRCARMENSLDNITIIKPLTLITLRFSTHRRVFIPMRDYHVINEMKSAKK